MAFQRATTQTKTRRIQGSYALQGLTYNVNIMLDNSEKGKRERIVLFLFCFWLKSIIF